MKLDEEIRREIFLKCIKFNIKVRNLKVKLSQTR